MADGLPVLAGHGWLTVEAVGGAPDLALLFWYYKEPEVCAQRLKELRGLNPRSKIFGLYGGDVADVGAYRALRQWLDDDWVFGRDHDAQWKWRNGDLMLADWFDRRGRGLTWDSVVIVQWDILTRAPVSRIFAPIQRDDVYLPGLRRIQEISTFWWWVQHETPEGDAFARFEATVRQRDNRADLWACQFLTAVLPRRFFEEFQADAEKDIGFLEYKLPTFAKQRGFHCVALPHLRVIWEKEAVPHGRIVLSAGKAPIASKAILAELLSRDGARMFHPVADRYRFGLGSIAFGVIEEALRPLVDFVRRAVRGAARRALRVRRR